MTTRAHLDDRQVAVRYLADKLSTPDIEAFEEHYLEHPDVVEELELDAKLKAGLMCIRDCGELDRLTTVRKGSWAVTPMAIAASILVASSVLVFRQAADEIVMAASAGALGSQLATGEPVTLRQTRSQSYDATIALPSTPQAIKLQMVPDMDPPIPPLAVTLTAMAENSARKDLAVLHQLRADEAGIVTFYLNSAAIRPGTYELSVSKEAAPNEAPENTFILEVTAPEGSRR